MHPTIASARPAGLLAAALLLLPAALTAQRTMTGSTDAVAMNTAPEPPLRPGDVIQITSWREPGLAGEFTVRDDGTVSLPLIGKRTVTDVPADQLTQDLQEEYGSKFRRPTVEIFPKRRVRILGAVRQPGLYYVDQTMTLGDAVALAGGADVNGNWKDVRILRDGERVDVRLDKGTQVGKEVRSGDQIILPEAGWFSRNSGVLIGASISATAIILSRYLFANGG